MTPTRDHVIGSGHRTAPLHAVRTGVESSPLLCRYAECFRSATAWRERPRALASRPSCVNVNRYETTMAAFRLSSHHYSCFHISYLINTQGVLLYNLYFIDTFFYKNNKYILFNKLNRLQCASTFFQTHILLCSAASAQTRTFKTVWHWSARAPHLFLFLDLAFPQHTLHFSGV